MQWENSISYRIFLDGERLLCDETATSRTMKEPVRKISGAFVEGKDQSIWWTSFQGDGLYGQLRDMKDPESLANLQATLIDARLLGLAPVALGNLVNYQFESFLKNTDRQSETLERTTVGGHEAWKISWTRKNTGARVETTIVPDQRFSIVEMRMTFRGGDNKEYAEWVELANEKHAASGIWFPVRGSAKRSVDGQVTFDQTMTIHVRMMNGEFERDPFLLENMDLPAKARFELQE